MQIIPNTYIRSKNIGVQVGLHFLWISTGPSGVTTCNRTTNSLLQTEERGPEMS